MRIVVKISVRSIRLLSNRQRYNNKTSTSISISSFQLLSEPDIRSLLLINVECTLSSFAGRGWTRWERCMTALEKWLPLTRRTGRAHWQEMTPSTTASIGSNLWGGMYHNYRKNVDNTAYVSIRIGYRDDLHCLLCWLFCLQLLWSIYLKWVCCTD